jgi:hypothetical protein
MKRSAYFDNLRIALTLLVILHHTAIGYGAFHTNSTTISFFDFIWNNIRQYPGTGHMWFVLALLIFESVYVLYRKHPEISIARFIPANIPSNRNIAVLICACGTFAFLLRLVYPVGGKNIIGLQFGYFTLYIAFYSLGIIAKRKKWMDRLSYGKSILWFFFAIAVIPLIVAAWIDLTKYPEHMTEYIGGFHWRSLFLTFWEAIVCLGICYFAIMAFKKYLNTSTKMSVTVASDSYTAYVIHPVIVVGITMLFEPVNLSPFIKFLIAWTIIVIVCYILAHIIRMLPGLKRVL